MMLLAENPKRSTRIMTKFGSGGILISDSTSKASNRRGDCPEASTVAKEGRGTHNERFLRLVDDIKDYDLSSVVE